MTEPYLIPEDMARPPSAIYLSKSPGRRYLSCALAFEGHEQFLKVMDKPRNMFFQECKPCVAYQDGSCPGGMNFLYRREAGDLVVTHPIHGRIVINRATKDCIKRFENNLESLNNTEVDVKTFFPSYVLTTSGNSDFVDGKYWFMLETEMFDEDDPSTLWKASPMPLPNVYANGEICFGRNRIRNSFNFKEIQSTIFGMIYNRDLFDSYYYGASSPRAYLESLSYEKAKDVFNRRTDYARGQDRYIPGSRSAACRRILPPIFKEIWVNDLTNQVHLKDYSGRVFFIENDLSGPITPVPVGN